MDGRKVLPSVGIVLAGLAKWTIAQGDCLEHLRRMPDESIQCAVTSPPYYRLRDYNTGSAQIGQEESPEQYISRLVAVFREVRRVLRNDGVLWLNLGDCYSDGKSRVWGMKPKDLMGLPWRVAFALQEDGWFLRSAPPWIKRAPMPESVEDRPGSGHEYVFLLTKSPAYYYDWVAVAKAVAESSVQRLNQHLSQQAGSKRANGGAKTNGPLKAVGSTTGRNRRTSDWWFESLDAEISALRARLQYLERVRGEGGLMLDEEGQPGAFMVNTKPFKSAHFAVWPDDLVEPMILASSSPYACPHCRAPWRRVVERHALLGDRTDTGRTHSTQEHRMGRSPAPENGWQATRHTIGWEPTCGCTENDGSGQCVVLDPFSGSGTSGMVALRHQRGYVGIELNAEYVELSTRRIIEDSPLLNQVCHELQPVPDRQMVLL